jgi:uncharacterized cupredoxin-like copper-binding protein
VDGSNRPWGATGIAARIVRGSGRLAAGRLAAGWLAAALTLGACQSAQPTATPPIMPGTAAAPREVNLIAKDYSFVPDVMDLIPGEVILLHVINGGLEIHEAIIGDMAVQDAWEVAEAATVGAPPGPTPAVSVPPDVAGLRVVVRSGERVDVTWTVPDTSAPLIVGCHIPGHWAKGMQIPVRWVAGTDGPSAPPA